MLVAQLRGTAPAQVSTVAITGPVNLKGGTLQANLENGFALAAGQSFTVATYTPGRLNGLFGGLEQGGSSGTSGTTLNLGGGGLTLGAVYNDHADNIQLQVVNTPASTAVAWNGGTGTFSTAPQWSTSAVPTFYNDVTIGATASGNVTLNQDATISSLTITSGNTLQYQAATPQTLTVGQGVTVAGWRQRRDADARHGGGQTGAGRRVREHRRQNHHDRQRRLDQRAGCRHQQRTDLDPGRQLHSRQRGQ